jgi:hypothetical protein
MIASLCLVQPHMSPQHGPTLEVERILMVDFNSTQPRAKEVAPSASCEGGQTEAATAKPLSTSPLLTTDREDKMYRQLAEIQAIVTAQLEECARWCRSDPTPSPVWAKTNWQRPTVMPSVARLAP